MAEIEEVAIQIDDQSETSMETSQEFTVPVDELEIYLKNTISGLPGPLFKRRLTTIFRLPRSIHETNKTICEPNLVAIGPYHHGKKCFQTFEEHKQYVLRDFIARGKVGLEVYLQAMRSIEEEARNCYSETVDLGSDDFVKMLLLDGGCILEWFFLEQAGEPDTLLVIGWARAGILLSDLCLLENQVPFFVLHLLWDIRTQGGLGRRRCEGHCPLLKLLCSVLQKKIDYAPFRTPQISCGEIHHLLHLCYAGVVPDPQSQTPASSEQSQFAPVDRTWTTPSISELHNAGVTFKRKKNSANVFDISFTNGTFEIPFLQIQSPTIRILWNMVAFEQSRYAWGLPQTLSSYFALMDTLINTGKDIAILEQNGIFENLFQNVEDAATYFNQFDRFFVLDYKWHNFEGLFQNVRVYSQSKWHRHRARLMQDYFSNPWTIISVVAAGILLILTGIQTYYSAVR